MPATRTWASGPDFLADASRPVSMRSAREKGEAVSASTDGQLERTRTADCELHGDQRMALWIRPGQAHNDEFAWHGLMFVYWEA